MQGVIREGNKYRPVALCDHCNHMIEDGRNGNYLWEVDEHAEPTGRIAFTHKQCNRAFEADNPPASRWLSDSLTFYPLMLAANLKVDWKKDMERLKLFHSIQL